MAINETEGAPTNVDWPRHLNTQNFGLQLFAKF